MIIKNIPLKFSVIDLKYRNSLKKALLNRVQNKINI